MDRGGRPPTPDEHRARRPSRADRVPLGAALPRELIAASRLLGALDVQRRRAIGSDDLVNGGALLTGRQQDARGNGSARDVREAQPVPAQKPHDSSVAR